MKRSAKQESKCRRTEFKCRLYEIIKDLERSLEPEPSHQSQLHNGLGEHQLKTMANKGKNLECCCPPGCCKESLKLRLPNLAATNRDNAQPTTHTGVSEMTTREDAMGHLPWHEDDHGNGCWPRHGVQRPGVVGGVDGAGGAGTTGGVRYYCCDSNPVQTQSPNYHLPTSRLPNTTEEMQQMGCFFARAA